jgi:hypothetical protein
VFTGDEFNLLAPSVMMALIAFLEARVGDILIHPQTEDKLLLLLAFYLL